MGWPKDFERLFARMHDNDMVFVRESEICDRDCSIDIRKCAYTMYCGYGDDGDEKKIDLETVVVKDGYVRGMKKPKKRVFRPATII